MNVELNMVGRAVAGTLLAVALGTGTASAEEIVRTLYAGQTLPVGTVKITTGTPGQVDFELDSSNSFCLTEIHVAVGEIGTGIPVNKQGSPQVGRFPYQDYPAYPPCEKSSGFQIAEGIDEDDNVAAHAKLQYGDTYATESAWAAGYNFTQTSWATYVPVVLPPVEPTKKVFARAYMERDGTPGYTPGSLNDPDSLIAELVDDNNSGFVDVGDKVYTDQYPTTFNTDPRADFGVNEHEVTYVSVVYNTEFGKVVQVYVAGGVITFGYSKGADFSLESYSEGTSVAASQETTLIADGTGDNPDTLKVLAYKGPSQPEEAVALTTRPGNVDDGFINIDFDLP